MQKYRSLSIKDSTQMNQNEYQTFIELLPEGFAYLEAVNPETGRQTDLVFRYVNQAFEKLTGFPRTKLIGEKLSELSTVYDNLGIARDRLIQMMHLNLEEVVFEHYIDKYDRWTEIKAYTGSENQISVLIREITSQKKNELEQIYQNKSLKTLFDNSFDAVVSIDADDLVLDVNDNFCKMFGYRRGEIIGRQIDDVMNQSKPGSADEESTARVLAGQKVEKEAVRYTKQGDPLDVMIRALPIIIDNKRVGAYAFYSNITKRKIAERELRERESKYNAIFEGSHDAITVVNEDGMFIDCNQRALDLYGLESKDDFLMTRPSDFSPLLQPDGTTSLEASRDKISKALITKEHIHFEWIHQRKNGETFPAEVILKAFTLKGRTVLQGSVRDITDRKQAEDNLRYISFHDNLTGTYNRAYFDEEAKRLDADRQLPISIIMADLNGLKLINDTYGHAEGDKMLIKAAELIKNSCRQEDIIARWGGDEFVVFLPRTNLDQANIIGKRIADNCRTAYVKEIPISMALGISCKNYKTTELAKILRDAEDNMYKQKLTESRSTKSAVLKALLKTLAEKSFETEVHTRRMQKIARQIGEKIKLPDAELKRLELLITLHDIGKINISEEILTKRGPLTETEWEIIKTHPEIGYRIARATEEFAHVAQDILAHHERWDGKGYPQGLKGSKIPLLARITAIADAYEVMSNGRPYKKSLSADEVIKEFNICAGTQFDPELTRIFFSCLE